MKHSDITPKGYTAWVLSQEDRDLLSEVFPPQYEKWIGHHITQAFGVTEDMLDRADHEFKVVGRVDSGDGLEALIVEIDGSSNRPDGSIYHITWSLDPDKYKPKDSNALIARLGPSREWMVTSIFPVSTFIPF
jgi:hypothetical protein